jgi:hypothetical protein
MIMSPDNKTDWTRAVCLIYSVLGLASENIRFNPSILSFIDIRLSFTTYNNQYKKHSSSPHPEESQSKSPKTNVSLPPETDMLSVFHEIRALLRLL